MKSDELLESIGRIDDTLITEAKRVRHRNKLGMGKYLIAAAVLLLCISATVPVLAAYVPGTYEILYMVSPAIAQKLKPVQLSCEDNGIRMEVLSASIEGDSAHIYIALQDLEGERIDETTDLFDSYRINRPFDCSATCQMVNYDDTTRTATFLISITQWGNVEIEGSKLTFSVDCFLSGKEHIAGVLPDIHLTEADFTPETRPVYDSLRGYTVPENVPEGELTGNGLEKADYLVPQSSGIISPADGVAITAVGYIDGKLHIQTYYEDIHHTDNHGYLYLKDKNGTIIYPSYSVSFWDEEQRGSYDEDVFDISADALTDFSLYGEFWTCDTLIEGDWQVTFPLSSGT